VSLFALRSLRAAAHCLCLPIALEVAKLAVPLTESSLAIPLRTVLAAKQYGNEELLARIVSEASLLVMPRDPRGFNVDNVRVVKIMGGSLYDSRVVKGMVFNREPEG
jgi:T-complex protein 1 subunit theta